MRIVSILMLLIGLIYCTPEEQRMEESGTREGRDASTGSQGGGSY